MRKNTKKTVHRVAKKVTRRTKKTAARKAVTRRISAKSLLPKLEALEAQVRALTEKVEVLSIPQEPRLGYVTENGPTEMQNQGLGGNVIG